MRSPTPGFNGARLREARQARGLTAVSLEDLSGVSAKLISNYEHSKVTPSPETVKALSTVLRLPHEFFILPDRDYARGAVFNRSMAATTKRARVRSDHRLTWLRDIVSYLSGFVSFPDPNLPELDLPKDPLLQLSDEDIEEVAGEVREQWNLRRGPVANMILLLENQGVIVARDQLGAQDLEGKSERPPGDRPFVMVGTDRGTPVRWRFDAAHELGHLVLHAHVTDNELHRRENHALVERQAHRFAAAFLLPAAEFGDELYAANLDALRALKPRWKTSIAMMITRMSDLDFINDEAKKKLWISLSRRKWRREEPYDDTMEAEHPRLLSTAFEMVLREGLQTPDDVLTQLALEPDDVERLAGLDPGYLAAFTRVGLITAAEPRAHDPTATPATVIPLRPRNHSH